MSRLDFQVEDLRGTVLDVGQVSYIRVEVHLGVVSVTWPTTLDASDTFEAIRPITGDARTAMIRGENFAGDLEPFEVISVADESTTLARLDTDAYSFVWQLSEPDRRGATDRRFGLLGEAIDHSLLAFLLKATAVPELHPLVTTITERIQHEIHTLQGRR